MTTAINFVLILVWFIICDIIESMDLAKWGKKNSDHYNTSGLVWSIIFDVITLALLVTSIILVLVEVSVRFDLVIVTLPLAHGAPSLGIADALVAPCHGGRHLTATWTPDPLPTVPPPPRSASRSRSCGAS